MSYLYTLSDEQVTDMRDHFYSLGWGQNETMWKCWCQALDYLALQLSAQEPRAFAICGETGNVLNVSTSRSAYGLDADLSELQLRVMQLYAAPVIPPDVAELQRENAELTRKLADSEKARKQYFAEMCEVIEKNSELTRKLAERKVHLDAALEQLQCACSYEEPQHVCEYHRKLLAEARSKAMPEDSARLDWLIQHCAFLSHSRDGEVCNVWFSQDPNDELEGQVPVEGYPQKCYNDARQAIDAAMLAAAPQPGGSNE